jgi:hypothetical protein
VRSATGRALLQGSSFTRKQAMTKGRALETVQGHLSSAAAYPDRAARHSLYPPGRNARSSRRAVRRGAHPLFVGDFAALRPSVEEPGVLVPILCLKGVSAGDFGGGADRPSQGRRRAVGPQPSDGSRRLGRRNMRAGAKAVSPMSSAGP